MTLPPELWGNVSRYCDFYTLTKCPSLIKYNKKAYLIRKIAHKMCEKNYIYCSFDNVLDEFILKGKESNFIRWNHKNNILPSYLDKKFVTTCYNSFAYYIDLFTNLPWVENQWPYEKKYKYIYLKIPYTSDLPTNFIIIGKNIRKVSLYLCKKNVENQFFLGANFVNYKPFHQLFPPREIFFLFSHFIIIAEEVSCIYIRKIIRESLPKQKEDKRIVMKIQHPALNLRKIKSIKLSYNSVKFVPM